MFISGFDKERQEKFLNLAYTMVYADGRLDEREQQLFASYGVEVDLSIDMAKVHAVDFAAELTAFDECTPVDKQKIFFELYAIALIDESYSDAEKVLVEQVKVFMPPSKILDIYADVDSFNIRLQDAGLLASNIKIEEQNAWVAADVSEQGRRAVQEGLLLCADDNARQLLLSKLNNRGLPGDFELEVVTLNAGNDVRQLNPPQ